MPLERHRPIGLHKNKMQVAAYFWNQLSFHVKNWATLWDFINIGLPVLVPFAGMLMVMALKTTDSRHDLNAKLMATVKDGQLGYIAAVMDLSMLYDQLGHLVTTAAFIAQMVAVLCIICGTLIAAHGAVYTTEMPSKVKGMRGCFKHYRLMWFSAAITLIAAITYHHTHHYLVHS